MQEFCWFQNSYLKISESPINILAKHPIDRRKKLLGFIIRARVSTYVLGALDHGLLAKSNSTDWCQTLGVERTCKIFLVTEI